MECLKGRSLILLGAPRSGTSVTVNAFRQMGFYLGDDEDFNKPKEGNPQGNFERRELLALNERILDAMYLGHERPPLLDFATHPLAPRFAKEAQSVLESEFGGQERWGWKDPKTTFVAPIYQMALDAAGIPASYLVCVRNPAEVIASQQKIYDSSEVKLEAPIGPRAYLRWTTYTLESLRHAAGKPSAVVVYNQLIEEPRRVLAEAYEAVVGEAPSAEGLDAATALIRVDLHRNKSAGAAPKDAPAFVHDLWSLCCELGKDIQGCREGKYDLQLEALQREVSQLRNVFSEPDPPIGTIELHAGGEPLRVAYLPSAGWTSIKLSFDAKANTDILGNLYPLPANVYIRNARWADGQKAKIKGIYDVVEAQEEGCTRYLLGISNPQIAVRTPIEPGPYELTFEVFAVLNIFTAFESLYRQTQRTVNLNQQVQALTEHASKLERQLSQAPLRR